MARLFCRMPVQRGWSKEKASGEQQRLACARRERFEVAGPRSGGRLCLRLPSSFYPVEGYIQLALDVLLLVDSALVKETGGSEHVRGEEWERREEEG